MNIGEFLYQQLIGHTLRTGMVIGGTAIGATVLVVGLIVWLF